LEDLFKVSYAIHGNLGDVKKTRHASNFDEGSVRLECLDDTVNYVTSGELGHLLLNNSTTVGNNEFVILLVHLEELEGKSLSNEVVIGKTSGKVRSGEEGTKSFNEEDGSSAVDTDTLSLKYFIGILLGNDLIPCLTVLDASDRNQELTILVFLGDDFKLTFLVDINDTFDGLSLLLEKGSLLERKVGRSLGTNIHDAATLVVLNDGSLDNVVTVECIISGGNGVGEGSV
jgi:hypothetical protein